jgi:hypothetical protein
MQQIRRTVQLKGQQVSARPSGAGEGEEGEGGGHGIAESLTMALKRSPIYTAYCSCVG